MTMEATVEMSKRIIEVIKGTGCRSLVNALLLCKYLLATWKRRSGGDNTLRYNGACNSIGNSVTFRQGRTVKSKFEIHINTKRQI